jgi:hypothetical protein
MNMPIAKPMGRTFIHRLFSFLIISFLINSVALTAAEAQIRLVKYQNREAWQLEGKELRVTVMQGGGHLAEIVLKGDHEVNPLWLPATPTIDPTEFDPGRHEKLFGGGPAARLMSGLLGHNLCFPYWGDPSDSEYKAGMTYHGETGIVRWKKLSEKNSGTSAEIKLAADLPESSTRFVRTLSVVSGESVVYFEGRAENLAALDRPVGWCEHVTVGPPFLKKGMTLFDASLTLGRNYDSQSSAKFQWPMGEAEVAVDLRTLRNIESSGFVNNFLVDPARKYGYFTAVNPELRLLFGYLFPRTDFRWLNLWETNTPAGNSRPAMLARGMEFSNTPTHGSIKTLVKASTVFDVPAFEWLDAKSSLVKKFCAFSTRVPEEFSGVQDIKVEKDHLEIVERGKGRVMNVPFQREKLE